MQVDSAFLSLVSSQRELLSQLRSEPPRRRNPQHSDLSRRDIHSTKMNLFNPVACSFPSSRDSIQTNQPIGAPEESSSVFLLPSRRLSIGLVGLDSTAALFGYAGRESDQCDDEIGGVYGRKLGKQDFHLDSNGRGKKRRLSSMGLIGPSIFEDCLKVGGTTVADKTREDDQRHELDRMLSLQEQSSSKEAVEAPSPPKRRTTAGSAKLRSVMVSFTDAMERSQQSQQDIHNWDRKMGLKRSHSKTMRQSSRSRKKLSSVLKKEITTLVTSPVSSAAIRSK